MPAPPVAATAPVVHCQVAHGRALFNQGDFWGCHESLEVAWLAAPAAERSTIQGVIQGAAAFHKYVVQDNAAGAVRLIRRALGNLAGATGDDLGLDLDAFRSELRAWERRLLSSPPATGSLPGLPQLAWGPAAAARRMAVTAVRAVQVDCDGRPAILVALEAGTHVGWGECRVAWDAHGIWETLENALAPALLVEPIAAPSEVPVRARGLAAMPAAMAGIEAAAWDLYARYLGGSLVHALGLVPRPVPLLGSADGVTAAELVGSGRARAAAGYREVLAPARPNADRRVIPQVVSGIPVAVAVDLGAAYRMADVQALLALDAAGATFLARPFPVEALDEAARLCRLLALPVSMGPWASPRQLEAALALDAADMVEVDSGLCGLAGALRMVHDATRAHRPVWASSSAATEIGWAADLAFAAHPAVTRLADAGWATVTASLASAIGAAGTAAPAPGPGLGVVPSPEWLAEATVRAAIWRA